MSDEDDDLFDAPVRTKKPSNKIVYQPAGASWSLDRLPEIETYYQTAFKKRLPLTTRGQGSIHNKWNYDHTNSADVSINPTSAEGKQFEAKLREMGVPFLAFTSAIPGVATGPHFHLGFPSRKTGKKFNIGAQRKKQSVASDDLFDADSDLFDQDQGQIPPPQTPRLSTRTATRPATSPSASVPANRLSQIAVGGVQGKDEWRPTSMQNQRKMFETPKPQRRSLLGEATTALPGVHQILRLLPEEDRENIVEGVTGAMAGTVKQLANTQDLGMQISGLKALGVPNPVTPRIRQAGQALENVVAENEAARPAPTTFTGNVRRGLGKGAGASAVELPKLLLGGTVLKAANLPVQGALSRADEGYTGIAKGAAGGLVYHYGGQLTGKAFSSVSPYLAKLGNSLVWIAGPVAEHQIAAKVTGSEAPNLAQSIGENIPFGIMAGLGAKGRQKRPEPVQVKEGDTVRPATEADLPKIISREIEVVPPAVEAAERRSIQREFDKIKERDAEVPDRPHEDVRPRTVATQEAVPETVEAVDGRSPELASQRFYHTQYGNVVKAADQTGARKGKTKVYVEDRPDEIHYPKTVDLRGRGNERMVPLKDAEVQPSPETVRVEPEGKPIWEMTRSELEAARGREQSAERDMLAQFLGKEDAARLVKLNRDYLNDKPVSAERDRLWAKLTPEQSKQVDEWYRGSEKRPSADDYRDYQRNLEDIAGSSDSEQTMANMLARIIPQLGRESDPSRMDDRGRRAYSQLKYAAEVSREAGLDPQRLEQLTKRAAGDLYGENAQFMLDALFKAKSAPKPETTSVEQGVKASNIATPQAEGIAKEGAGGKGAAEFPAPNIPERPETIQAQIESRGYSLIPKDTPRPPLPQGYRAEKTADGVVYYDPKRIDVETIRSTPTTELLGHVEPKSPTTTEAVVARTPEGTELHSSAVSPENLAKQIEVTKANFPEAKIEAGKGVAEKVIEERLEPSITSARKEMMSADRAELDLPQLPQAERKSWQSTLDKAKEKGTQRASILADEVLSSPRSLNEVETAQLVLRAQEIKNEHSRVMKEIGNEKNPESIQTKRAEVEALEREFDKLTKATKASGTEKGRALASQKLTINQDYDLVSLVQRAKAAKGRELTPEERTRYEDMAKEIESLTERLTKAEEELTSKRLQKEIDRVVRRGKRAETKKQLDDEFAMLAQQFAQARAQSKGIHSAGLAGLDPEGIYTPLIAKMARNRIRAGVVKAEEVVDHVYEALDGTFSKRDIRDAISGYGLERKGKPRSEDVKELARVKSELRKLSAQEDIEAGLRLSPAEKTRQTNLLKQEADLQRRLEEKDFDRPERRTLRYNRETQALESRVSKLKARYERELYLAQRGKLGAAWDVAVNVANVPKSLKSMGDVSAVLRQGGYFSITHPVLSTKAGLDMLRSFSETGFKNVEKEITSHRDFDLARRSGVEFTGVEKDNPNLSKREEAYLGGDIIDRAAEVPVAGKVVKPVRAVKDFSERTFVSFLDSQRMQVFSRFADHIRSLKMSPKEETKALKAMGQFVNIGTGRGSLGKSGNQIAPALNVLMFSPRLLASRVQLMNKMINPVAIQRMPKGARSQIIKDNVKFAGTIATALGLAKAAGAGVSLDPDDADFLKIRIGDSRYDILTGLQQPMRFIYRMARAVQADVTGDETYAGEGKGPLIKRFARSKAAPLAGGVADYISGEDFKGRKFKLSRQLIDLVTPLYINDFKEAMEEDGVAGALVKTSPALIGIGAQTYKDAPEKARTHAEKLARKFVRAKMPSNAREEEQIDIDQTKADLKAKSRRGEDVSKELEALGAKITSRQAKGILDARNKTRLQEDVNRLSALDAIIVWSVMNPGQQQETRSILERKASLIDNLPVDQQENVRRRYQEAGITAVTRKPSTKATGFKKAFTRQFATAP